MAKPTQCPKVKVATMRKPPAVQIMTMDNVGLPLPEIQEVPGVREVEGFLPLI
jgi:hypothetical protein